MRDVAALLGLSIRRAQQLIGEGKSRQPEPVLLAQPSRLTDGVVTGPDRRGRGLPGAPAPGLSARGVAVPGGGRFPGGHDPVHPRRDLPGPAGDGRPPAAAAGPDAGRGGPGRPGGALHGPGRVGRQPGPDHPGLGLIRGSVRRPGASRARDRGDGMARAAGHRGRGVPAARGAAERGRRARHPRVVSLPVRRRRPGRARDRGGLPQPPHAARGRGLSRQHHLRRHPPRRDPVRRRPARAATGGHRHDVRPGRVGQLGAWSRSTPRPRGCAGTGPPTWSRP